MLWKRTTVLFLMLAFLAQAFSRYFIIADYYVDNSTYLENCINKDKPWMKCNGRCQLCKKLHQQDNTDKQIPDRRAGGDRNDPLTSTPSNNGFTANNPFTVISLRYPEQPGRQTTRMPRSHFHPPGYQLS
jgi:hypothetical protein